MNWSFRAIGFCGILLVLASAGTVRAVQTFEALTLEIKVEKTLLIPYEPLGFVLTLKNETDEGIVGHTIIQPNAGFLRIYVARNDGPFVEYHSGDFPLGNPELAPRTIPAGSERSLRGRFWYGRTGENHLGALFPLPGVYRLKCTLSGPHGEGLIESNVVQVEVSEPAENDAEAFRYITGWEAKNKDFFFGTSGTPRGREKRQSEWKEFVDQFPGSTYAAYAHYASGMLYVAAKRVEEAARAFQKASEQKGFPLRDEALYWLVNVELRQARAAVARAREALAILKADHPDSPSTEGAEDLLNRSFGIE